MTSNQPIHSAESKENCNTGKKTPSHIAAIAATCLAANVAMTGLSNDVKATENHRGSGAVEQAQSDIEAAESNVRAYMIKNYTKYSGDKKLIGVLAIGLREAIEMGEGYTIDDFFELVREASDEADTKISVGNVTDLWEYFPKMSKEILEGNFSFFKKYYGMVATMEEDDEWTEKLAKATERAENATKRAEDATRRAERAKKGTQILQALAGDKYSRN